MTYSCQHFSLEELLPEKLFKQCQAKKINGWELFDDRLLKTIDEIRKKFGKTTINDWAWGGSRNWSGLRTPDSQYYSPTSQHSFGRAVDCIFEHCTAEEVRRHIIDHQNEFPFIRAIELDVSWLHLDTRNYTGVKQFRA